jgi:predicted porin
MAYISKAVAANSLTATLAVRSISGQAGAASNVTIYNKHATITVYVGDENVDNAGVVGIPILASGTFTANLYSNESIWVMAASGTPSVVVHQNRV